MVACSEGYPGSPVVDRKVKGIEKAESLEGVQVFQAGTRKAPRRTVLTSGGRVLTVVAQGTDRKDARARAYEGIGLIEFEGMYYRHDIAEESHQVIASEA